MRHYLRVRVEYVSYVEVEAETDGLADEEAISKAIADWDYADPTFDIETFNPEDFL